MNEAMNIFLGFDPGGSTEPAFGWSICTGDEAQFQEVCSGVSDIAEHVVNAVMGALDENGLLRANVRAAGIDAPLFWHSAGNLYRHVDVMIQADGGNPVSLNGLRGAVLYQGPVLARMLRQHFEALRLTEALPSALRNLLNPVPPELERIDGETPHQKDARTAAYAAWCMYRTAPGWRDLSLDEQRAFLLLDFPVSYWMPI